MNRLDFGIRRPMNVDYLRVSVTDRCNLRCIYCNPRGCGRFAERREILSFKEICRVVTLCTECGIRRVRLTGGEPLMRKDIVGLVQELARIAGIEDLSLTTNGVLLGPMAARLRQAGLKRLNISLDSADRRTYERITGRDSLSQVMHAIIKAIDLGFSPVRINCVVIRDVNFSQVQPLAEMSICLPVSVRFIEYCPTNGYTEPAGHFVPNVRVRHVLESRFGALSAVMPQDACGPAVYFKIERAAGTIGFISGRSSFFCSRCSRLRLSADGRIRPCLYAARGYDLGRLLRNGADDRDVLNLIKKTIREKSRFTRLNATSRDFSMRNIGG
jgi:cyclic pyranopterin phosphate synthase